MKLLKYTASFSSQWTCVVFSFFSTSICPLSREWNNPSIPTQQAWPFHHSRHRLVTHCKCLPYRTAMCCRGARNNKRGSTLQHQPHIAYVHRDLCQCCTTALESRKKSEMTGMTGMGKINAGISEVGISECRKFRNRFFKCRKFLN